MDAPDLHFFDDTRPSLGVIVLQADETLEDDLRRLFAPEQVRLHITRIPSGAELSPETIRAMEDDLPQAAGLFPKGMQFDAVAYACTSGTSLIGAARVAALVSGVCQTRHVTNPLSAGCAALHALGAQRIGLVSPYAAPIAAALQSDFEAAGFEVPKALSFGVAVEAQVARIAPDTLCTGARAVAQDAALDAVFLSCTNLRTLDVIAPLEEALGLPVLSSNQVLGWHMARCAGVPLDVPQYGRLLRA